MHTAKKTRKFAAVKRLLNPNDIRLKENQLKQKKKEEAEKEKAVKRAPQVASSLFLQHNTALVPPYRVLIDTNFINFSLQNKLELISGMMDCLYAKCIPCVTDCVMAELEKLGHRYRVALRVVPAKLESIVSDVAIQWNTPILGVGVGWMYVLSSGGTIEQGGRKGSFTSSGGALPGDDDEGARPLAHHESRTSVSFLHRALEPCQALHVMV
ncbi:LOW QUALITY PROTEIN: hypothetical protein ACG7TL_008783 [Trametes sanguinea]